METLPSLLAVDDDLTLLDLFQDALGQNYDLSVASSANDALKLLSKNSFDAVLIDLIMPSVSGPDLIRRIRRDSHTARIPIILTSAHPRVQQEGASLNVQAILSKPFTIDDLEYTLRRILWSRS